MAIIHRLLGNVWEQWQQQQQQYPQWRRTTVRQGSVAVTHTVACELATVGIHIVRFRVACYLRCFIFLPRLGVAFFFILMYGAPFNTDARLRPRAGFCLAPEGRYQMWPLSSSMLVSTSFGMPFVYAAILHEQPATRSSSSSCGTLQPSPPARLVQHDQWRCGTTTMTTTRPSL